MITDLLLIRPPQCFYHGTWPRGPRLSLPLGILSIATFIKNKNYSVKIYDCFVEGSNFQNNSSNESSLLENIIAAHESYSSSKSINNDNLSVPTHFGAGWDDLEKEIRNTSPKVVGITNLFRENESETLKTIRLVKKLDKNITVVLGGPNATANYFKLLSECPEIDFICTADGEYPMLEILQYVNNEIKKDEIHDVVYFDDKKNIVKNNKKDLVFDLDALGMPDYDLLQMERYFSYEKKGIMSRNKFSYNGADRAVSLVTSRGCPYKCVFCSVHIHAGRKFRMYSVEHTLNHLENLVKKYGVRHIHFEDDNLTLDRERFKEIMQGIISRELKFTWDTPNGVFANTIDEEMLILMKKTGCIYLVIGVESGDQFILDNVIKKQPLSIKEVKRVFSLGKKVGIDMQAFYIIGFPGEKKVNILRTLNFALYHLIVNNVIPHIAIARADPGTELFKTATENNHLFKNKVISNTIGVHSDMFVRHVIETKEFSHKYLEKINAKYHIFAIFVILFKTSFMLLLNPIMFFKTIKLFYTDIKKSQLTLNQAIVKIFFTHLFYRNSLRRYKELI